MKKETPAQRVYLVRLARGDGFKRPEKLEEFAVALNAAGARYDSSMLSRMENGTRRVTLEDIDAIAPLDPLKRGKPWLACWDDEASPVNVVPGAEKPEQGVRAYLAKKDKAAKKGGRNGGTKAG